MPFEPGSGLVRHGTGAAVRMAALAERRVSPVAGWAKRVSAFSLVLLVTACVGHRYGMVETVAFFWVLGLAFALAVLGFGLAMGGFNRLWVHGEKAGRASLAATLLSSLVLAPFLFAAYLVVTHPALNDMSTDLSEPPQFVVAPRLRTARMNTIVPISPEAAERQLQHYPDVSGRRYDASLNRVLSAVVAVMQANGWRPRGRLPGPDTLIQGPGLSIEAEAPSFLLRLPADAVVRLTDEGESTFVDMRLNIRYGKHDFGSNARRIRGFMAQLDAEFARQTLQIIDIPPSDEDEDAVD